MMIGRVSQNNINIRLITAYIKSLLWLKKGPNLPQGSADRKKSHNYNNFCSPNEGQIQNILKGKGLLVPVAFIPLFRQVLLKLFYLKDGKNYKTELF